MYKKNLFIRFVINFFDTWRADFLPSILAWSSQPFKYYNHITIFNKNQAENVSYNNPSSFSLLITDTTVFALFIV